MHLGDVIKRYRSEHGRMSMQSFADKCGLSKGYIAMLERNVNSKTGEPVVPSIETFIKVASAMDMTLDELTNIVDENQPVSLIHSEFAKRPSNSRGISTERLAELSDLYLKLQDTTNKSEIETILRRIRRIEYLIDNVFPKNNEVTPEEFENIIEKYRDLDSHGKEMVDFTLEKEWERVKEKEPELIMPTPEQVLEFINTPDKSIVADAAHSRTDIEVNEGTDTSEDNIMDEKNF